MNSDTLSILNYGVGINVQAPDHAAREDSAIIREVTKIVESMKMGKGAVIVSEVAHTDLPNLNYAIYPKKGMDKAVKTFHTPYPTPFLMHHADGEGGLLSDGDKELLSVGTNLLAKFINKETETPAGKASGYVKVGTFVPNESMIGNSTSAISALQSRRLLTVSMGASFRKDNVYCSICEEKLYSEECEHERGGSYDNNICYGVMYHPVFREYSAVYRPADMGALVRRMDVIDAEGNAIDNDGWLLEQSAAACNLSIYETASGVYGVGMDFNTNSKGEESMKIEDLNLGEMTKLLKQYRTIIKNQEDAIANLQEVVHELSNELSTILDEKLSTEDDNNTEDSAEDNETSENTDDKSSDDSQEDDSTEDDSGESEESNSEETSDDNDETGEESESESTEEAGDSEENIDDNQEDSESTESDTDTEDSENEGTDDHEETNDSSDNEDDDVDMRDYNQFFKQRALGTNMLRKQRAVGKNGKPFKFRSAADVIKRKS